MSDYDIEFFWDPVCPFAWITSRWVHKVVEQRDYEVDWRFISLRLLNKDKDYATEFPPEYPRMHGAGLRMLRVASAIRAEVGRALMGDLYSALGHSVFSQPQGSDIMQRIGEQEHLSGVLASLDLDPAFAEHADDESWDAELEVETELALSRTGRDVGTPIITFRPPDGNSFFGPVISRVPSDQDAVALWDSVIHLASFPGFAEMKRSLREMPQLPLLGLSGDDVGVEEDWQGGSRRSP